MSLPQPDESLFDVLHSMRAMRRLKPDRVPRELLEQIVDAATRAPSGSNLQNYHYVVVDDPATIARLAPLWRRAVGAALAAGGYLTPQDVHLPPTTSLEQLERTVAAIRFMADRFEEVPALIVACLDMATVRRDFIATVRRDLRPPLGPNAQSFVKLGLPHSLVAARNLARYGQRSQAASILPGVENALIAARAVGLGAGLTTLHLLFEQEFKDVLGIPRSVTTWAVIPVGYPRGRFGPVRRRPLHESLHWNQW